MVKKVLLVLFSYHHKNTAKIADVIGKVLDAEIKTPDQINPEVLQSYSLIGFGSGISLFGIQESSGRVVAGKNGCLVRRKG